MSNPITRIRTGRTRRIKFEGSFNVSRTGLLLQNHFSPLPPTWSGFTYVKGYADQPSSPGSIGSSDFYVGWEWTEVAPSGTPQLFVNCFNPTGNSVVYSGIFLDLGLDVSGTCDWYYEIDIEEYVIVSSGPNFGNTAQDIYDRAEAEIRRNVEYVWIPKAGGSCEVRAACLGLVATLQGDIPAGYWDFASTDAIRAATVPPEVRCFCGGINLVPEDDRIWPAAVWMSFVNNPDYLNSFRLSASVTGPWGIEDDGFKWREDTDMGALGTWTIEGSQGRSQAVPTDYYTGWLYGGIATWSGTGVYAFGGPKLEVNLDLRLRYLKQLHPLASEGWFRIHQKGRPGGADTSDVVVASRFAGGLLSFYNYSYYTSWGPVHSRLEYRKGLSIDIEPTTDLPALSGGHQDKRVLIRGNGTDVATVRVADSYDFVTQSGDWNPSGTGRQSSALPSNKRNFNAYRFFTLETTGMSPGDVLTLSFYQNDFSNPSIVAKGKVKADGTAVFDGAVTYATSASPNLVDAIAVAVGGPSTVVKLEVGGLRTGAFCKKLSGTKRSASLLTTMRDFLTLRTDGRFVFNYPSTRFPANSASSVPFQELKTLLERINGVTVTLADVSSFASGGGGLYLGGAGSVYLQEGWKDHVSNDTASTDVYGCELYDHITLYPKSGDIWGDTGVLDVPIPIRATKILGTWVEGALPSRKLGPMAGGKVILTLGTSVLEAFSDSIGYFSFPNFGPQAGQDFGDLTSQGVLAHKESTVNISWLNRLFQRWITFFIPDKLTPTGFHLCRDPQGVMFAVKSSDDGLQLFRFTPNKTIDDQFTILSGQSGIGAAQIAYLPEGSLGVVYEHSGMIRQIRNAGFGENDFWTQPMDVAPGTNPAYATDEKLGIEYVVCYDTGTWKCYKKEPRGSWEFVANVVDTPTDSSTAGLELSPNGSRELIFIYEDEGTNKRIYSGVQGQNWNTL